MPVMFIINREVRKTKRGFRLWETCSDGTPISPFFKTLNELAEWAEKNVTTFADIKATKEEWMEIFSGKKITA